VLGDSLLLQVRFASGTFSARTTCPTFLLDTDQNPFTGSRGVDGASNDKGLIGVEYMVDIRSTCYGDRARIRQFGGVDRWEDIGTAPVAFPRDGMDVRIPLSLLGGTGRLNFKVVTSSELSHCAWTGILDYMPDIGLLPGKTSLR